MPVPEPGQLVTLRQRRCVVLAVRADDAAGAPQHVVVARALGGGADVLQLVWEIEPGARIVGGAAEVVEPAAPGRVSSAAREALAAGLGEREIAEALGRQVRAAVELLVRTLDRIDREGPRARLVDVEPREVHRAAVTVMMRVVFLLAAEGRGLLAPRGELYRRHYAATTLREQLEDQARGGGEQALAGQHSAWCRLLALARAVHGGCSHGELRLPARGGSLFDPDVHPFLEGRDPKTTWREVQATPPPVDDRTVLQLLRAAQLLEVRGPDGSRELRRVDHGELAVEQIGRVYEGLVDHGAVRASGPMLGLRGARGQDPAIGLEELERLSGDRGALLARLRERTGRGSETLRRALEAGPGASAELRRRLLCACEGDAGLLARVVPWSALLRRDLRQIPAVFPAGSLYVTQVGERRTTGTHYTPRELTGPIVRHTLDPLCHVGPAEGLPREAWLVRPPAEILGLRVCDLAMGSGAFLVEACRYLADRLIEGWEAERSGPREAGAREGAARRLVAERCIFGVDRDPRAVEMARLSLWLESRQDGAPFTFVDHALKSGDSLLGLSSAAQLGPLLVGRRCPQGQVGELRTLADVITSSALHASRVRAHASERASEASEDPAVFVSQVLACPSLAGKLARVLAALRGASDGDARAAVFAALAELAWRQLGGDPEGGVRVPFHWPLEFPAVLQREGSPGFDAFVGNPPFQGGLRIRGALGGDYRDYLVEHVAGGRRGSADLCAYFFLRAAALTRTPGQLGLVATNTIAQGDTREVGLDQLTAQGVEVVRAISSEPWPGEANLEVAQIWLRKGPYAGERALDRVPVTSISSALTRPGRVAGKPHRLKANADLSFIGSYVLGRGFVLAPQEASELLARSPRSREVIFPYINGEELNSLPAIAPVRSIINFGDMPLERAASDYADCLEIVRARVKPGRDRLAAGDATARDRARRWWQFARPTMNLYRRAAGCERLLARALTSKHHGFVAVPRGWIYDQTCPVYLFEAPDAFAVLQSDLHYQWSLEFGASLETRPRYTPSDCFETFPFPGECEGLGEVGARYEAHRGALMQASREGLTRTCNRLHDPAERSPEIAELRALHVEIDVEVARAYGWSDLGLGHGFHATRQGLRFTVSAAARRELLDRLLALNHARHAEEVAAGLHARR